MSDSIANWPPLDDIHFLLGRLVLGEEQRTVEKDEQIIRSWLAALGPSPELRAAREEIERLKAALELQQSGDWEQRADRLQDRLREADEEIARLRSQVASLITDAHEEITANEEVLDLSDELRHWYSLSDRRGILRHRHPSRTGPRQRPRGPRRRAESGEMKQHTQYLKSLGACEDAVAFVAGHRTARAAYHACTRGDWLLWLWARQIKRQGDAVHRKVVLAACACARLSLKHVPAGEDRPRLSIETAEAWARRERGVTLAQVKAAAWAAWVAEAEAEAAAWAARAAEAPAGVAAWAAEAEAEAEAAAAAWAEAEATREKTLAKCADLVRGFFPKPPETRRKK